MPRRTSRRGIRRRTSRRRVSRNKASQDKVAKEFKKLVNMTPSQIRKWRKDERAKEASYPKTRRELELLAKMKKKSPKSWTSAMWKKARRTVAFIKRHEAQMKKQGKKYGTGRYHYTRKRVIALLNWGRIPPGVKVEGL